MNIENIVKQIEDNYMAEEYEAPKDRVFPSRSVIIDIIKNLRALLFPGYFGYHFPQKENQTYFVGNLINEIRDLLFEQVKLALLFAGEKNADERAEEICDSFFEELPNVQSLLLKDVQAAFDGDPAAKSKQEVIFAYPGLFAIFIYRIAHVLYEQNVPLIPRLMTEYGHSGTGVDINAGAKIGEYFFMDHATGIVIGETTEIGNHVKLYQGVTLGALSTKDGQALSGVKRHPTICDNVVIYSNASVLGGDTVIGENAVIGGSAFITSSVPANTTVAVKNQELTIRGHES